MNNITPKEYIFSCSRYGCRGMFYCFNIDIKYDIESNMYIIIFYMIDEDNKHYVLNLQAKYIVNVYTGISNHFLLSPYLNRMTYTLYLKQVLNNTTYQIVIHKHDCIKLLNYLDTQYSMYFI